MAGSYPHLRALLALTCLCASRGEDGEDATALVEEASEHVASYKAWLDASLARDDSVDAFEPLFLLASARMLHFCPRDSAPAARDEVAFQLMTAFRYFDRPVAAEGKEGGEDGASACWFGASAEAESPSLRWVL